MGGIIMPYMGSMGQQGYVTPNQIPNLNLWYNASASSTTVNGVVTNNFQAAVTNGSSISKWVDLQAVGGDSNTNGGSGKNPTYTIPIQNGLGSVTYASASQNNLDVNPATFLNTKTGLTIYVLSRPTVFGAGKWPLVVTDTSLGIFWNGTNWTCGISTSYYGTVTITNDNTKFHMYGLVFTGGSSVNFRYDKAQKTLTYTGSAPANTGSSSYVYFGGDNRSGASGGALASTYMDGYIGEVLIWQRALSTAEIGSVEYYLNQKWGLGLA